MVILFTMLSSVVAYSQDCLKLIYPHDPENGFFNPDLVFLDTCNGLNATYGRVGFEIVFKYYSISVSSYTEDTIMYLPWNIIDTSYLSLRNFFQTLENNNGQFRLEKKFPSLNDSNLMGSRTYILHFDNFVYIDSVFNQLLSRNELTNVNIIDYTSISLGDIYHQEPSFQLGELANSDDEKGFLFNQYVDDEKPLTTLFSYHLLSKSWHLLICKVPLAWEITKGKSEVVIGIADRWGYDRNEEVYKQFRKINLLTSSHGKTTTQDLYYYQYNQEWDYDGNSDTEGNVLCPFIKEGDKYFGNPLDGWVRPVEIDNQNHGFHCQSIANSRLNNKGIVGVAPLCKSYRLSIADNYLGIDVDLEINDKIKYPDVISKSAASELDPEKSHFTDIAKEGIPIVSGWSYAFFQEDLILDAIDDYKNCNFDVKTLQVMGLSDNVLHKEVEFILWDPRIDLKEKKNQFMNYSKPYNYYSKGKPQFHVSNAIKLANNPQYEKVYWTGGIREKFHMGSNNPQKKQPNRVIKNPYYRDILAPSQDILAATPAYKIDDIEISGSFYSSKSGLSYAIPQVAGTVALMRSIDNILGVGVDQPKWFIPLRIYDIVTFCATKIPHIRFNDDPKDDNGQYLDLNYTRSVFKNNEIDILADNHDRYCSPREGYGLLNSFRCVIHSIPKKAEYEYSNNIILNSSICHELDSKHFIHFGSKIKEGQWVRELFNIDNGNVKPFNNWESYDPYKNIDINGSGTDNEVLNVLEWGGRHFPGNTTEPWKNNWGETILKGNTTITVPENFVACIDGIVRQPTEQYEITSPSYELSENCKFETSGSGKILITGYLRDVQLIGNIKTDDLDMKCSVSDESSPITYYDYTKLIVKSSNDENSEIYGIVNVEQNSVIGFESQTEYENKLIIQPGGEIHLKGSQGITIPSNSTLELAYGAEIRKETSSEIFISIESGGTLKIRKGAAVTIDVPIIVEPGGKLIFEDNTLAWIDEITIHENDGTLENGGLVFNTDNSKLGTWLLPAENKTGKVTIMPGASLYIPEVDKTTHPNVKEIAILGGIELYGHGEMAFPTPIHKVGSLIVEENSKFTCGPIVSSSFTNILFNKGSKISFASHNSDRCYGVSNISINGNFTAVGDASIPIEISGWKGPNKYTNTLFPNNTPQVYANISMGSEWNMNMLFSTLPSANFKYVKFTDVTIKTFNSHLEELISCNFLYNSSNFKTYKENGNSNIKSLYSDYKPNVLLSVTNTKLFPLMSPNIGGPNLTLTNCTFKDEAAPVMAWLTAENTANVPDYDYHLNGVFVQGLRNVTIDNSGLVNDNEQFKGLNSAVHSVNCSRVVVKNCSLSTSRRGFEDYGSSVNLCQNYTYRVNVPHSINNSKKWATFGNHFEQSNIAVELLNTISGQNFRGNHFDDYYNGLFMNYSRAYLRGELTSDPNDNPAFADKYGRNEFSIPTTTGDLPPEEIRSPFITSTNRTINSRSDIFFYNYPFDATDPDNYINFENNAINERRPLKIQCGQNKMGEYTPSHLYYYQETSENYPNINVVPNYNDWLPISAIRNNSLISIGEPNNNLNVHELRITECTENLAEIQCEQYVPLVQPCDFYVRNTGNWPFEQNPDVVLDNDFYAYLNDFCNGILSCDCYRQRLFDLVQLASLGDSTDQKLEMINDCILDKLNDPVYNTALNCNISDLMLNLGESYERRGLFDDALDAYYYVLSNTQNSTDTTLARWRVMNLEAIRIDTTFGFVYDSLMKEYYRRVDYDITKTYIHSGGSNPPPKISIENSENNEESLPIAELEQNAPNPFTNETVIKFRLNKEADVRLAIHNNLGHTVKVLVNQRLMPGNFVYTYFSDGLSNGIYLYLLTTEGKQFTKKIQLIK